jgi:glycosyltransferase involved in cell wall biosynthesis
MDNLPLVSVLITTHNRSDLLKRAIESALHQTYKPLEIIVIDDGSTDDTEEVVNGYLKRYDNLKYLKHSEAKGANVARNNGIRHAQGKYIAGLDDDDEFSDNYIEALVNAYDDHYSCVVAGTKVVMPRKTILVTKKDMIDLNDLLYFNEVGNQVLVKKENLIKAGMFDESLPACQDYDMWVRLISVCGPAKGVNLAPQIMYQNHDKNRISTKSHKKFKGYFMFYKKHKNKMSRQQRQSQLFTIYSHQKKKLSLHYFMVFFHRRNFVKMLQYKKREWYYNIRQVFTSN